MNVPTLVLLLILVLILDQVPGLTPGLPHSGVFPKQDCKPGDRA